MELRLELVSSLDSDESGPPNIPNLRFPTNKKVDPLEAGYTVTLRSKFTSEHSWEAWFFST
jgi:hypothetical protein